MAPFFEPRSSFNSSYIKRLRELGFNSIFFVEDELFADIKIEEPLRIETKEKLKKYFLKRLRNYKEAVSFPMKR